MGNYSKGFGKDCQDCVYSRRANVREPSHLVCKNPQILEVTGGPRSCQDMVRAPFGMCKPQAHFYKAKP